MLDVPEEWSTIDGFPDYAVSNHGRVMNVRTNKELTPRINSYGHYRVALYKDNQRHEFYVHRLVAAAFMDSFDPHHQVKHAQGSTNHVYNLRFPAGHRIGRLIKQPNRPVYRRIRVVETAMIFRTVEDCAEYLGGDVSSIYRVLRGERLSHKGFTFEYVEEQTNG